MAAQFDPIDYTPASFRFDWDFDSSWRSGARDAYNRIRYPVLDARLRRTIPETVRLHRPDLILGEVVGIPRSITRNRIRRLLDRPPRRMLILGCGTAWDLSEWVRLNPVEVIGVDLYSFQKAWDEVRATVGRHGIQVRFFQGDLKDLSDIPDDWADVVISDAVLEHCVDLPTVLQETRRKARRGALIYASYGPLWFAPGGDHFCARGGIEAAFNHLLLAPNDYETFYRQHLHDDEDPQDGGRFVSLDLFSKLSSDQYLALYSRLGLARRFLALELSPLTPQFKRAFPSLWRELLNRYPAVREEEYSVKGHYVILQR